MNHPFRAEGVIVPLLTPVDAQENILFDELARLVDHVIEGGVDGIFVMGTSGEASRFAPDERAAIVKAAVEQAAGRVPVYAGVSDCGTRLVRRHIDAAAAAGASAVVTTVPYYFPTTSEKEILSFYNTIADYSPVPVIIYNIPVCVGVGLTCGIIEKLAGHPNIIGVKDSSGDPVLLDKLMVRFQRDDFTVLVGDESMLYNGFSKGVDGCIPSMANPFPRLLSGLYRAFRQGDKTKMTELCGVVNQFNLLNKVNDSWMSPNIWRKTALKLMGITGDCFTTPYEALTAFDEKKVQERVDLYNDMIARGII